MITNTPEFKAALNMARMFPASWARLRGRFDDSVQKAVDEKVSASEVADPQAANTLAASALWKVVSDKVADKTDKVLAPVMPAITDVRESVEMLPGGIAPIVQIPVVSTVGDALVNPSNWEQTDASISYAAVQSTRISRPVGMTTYNLANGDRLESTLAAQINTVAQGIYNQFLTTVKTAAGDAVAKPAISAATVKDIASIFGDAALVDNLILDIPSYNALIPEQTTDFRPDSLDVWGVHRITRGSMLTTGVNGFAIARGGVSGFVGTPKIEGFKAIETRIIETAYGVPMLVKTWEGADSEMIWVSVEAVCGFVASVPERIKALTFQS